MQLDLQPELPKVARVPRRGDARLIHGAALDSTPGLILANWVEEAVVSETWLPGYPTFVWRLAPGAGMAKTNALYALSQGNSVDRAGQKRP